MVGGATGIDNTDEALAAFGLVRETPAPAPQDDVIFPGNRKTVALFAAMLTQWRTGMHGVIGLDYTALPLAAKSHRIKLHSRRMKDLQTMERAALVYWQEQADRGRK